MTDWLSVISTLTPIIVAIVIVTAWITRKVTPVEKGVEGLDKRLNRTEDETFKQAYRAMTKHKARIKIRNTYASKNLLIQHSGPYRTGLILD